MYVCMYVCMYVFIYLLFIVYVAFSHVYFWRQKCFFHTHYGAKIRCQKPEPDFSEDEIIIRRFLVHTSWI